MSFDAQALRRDLVDALTRAGNPHRAVEQRLYLSSARHSAAARLRANAAMDFHGVAMPVVRQISKGLAAKHSPATVDQWRDACLLLWRGAMKREERYFCETWTGLKVAKAWQTPALISLYEEMIVTGAWWDLVDWLATHRMGDLLLRHRAAVAPTLRAWSVSDDLWKRRAAILSQNRHKQATDFGFLVEVIAPSVDSKEFFLRKAIGWALRDHARVDAGAVHRFVVDHADRLSGLSKREALKHFPPEVRAAVC
jgi:3-methyladenine DNA glycosylase AlkD